MLMKQLCWSMYKPCLSSLLLRHWSHHRDRRRYSWTWWRWWWLWCWPLSMFMMIIDYSIRQRQQWWLLLASISTSIRMVAADSMSGPSSSSMLSSTATSPLTNYEELFQWNPNGYRQHVQTLNTLQKLHNSSAILHFIDLSHNFTAEELNKCQRVSLNLLNFTVNQNSYDRFDQQADIAIRTSHFLTNLFSFKNIRENVSLHYLITNKDFYWSLLLANLQSNSQIFGAGLTFSNAFLNQILPNFKHFTPYIYRNEHSNNNNDTIRINLFNTHHQQQHDSSSSSSSSSSSEYFQSEWYWKFAYQNYQQDIIDEWRNIDRMFQHQQFTTKHNINNNNNNNNANNKMTTAKKSSSSSSASNNRKGVWSSPYLDCGITKTWLISYIVPFYGIIQDSPLLIGLVFVSINLQQIDMNQCSNANTFFSDTHKCHTPSTQCQNISGLGFRSGSYICKCRQGYYYPNSNSNSGSASALAVNPDPDSSSSSSQNGGQQSLHHYSSSTPFMSLLSSSSMIMEPRHHQQQQQYHSTSEEYIPIDDNGNDNDHYHLQQQPYQHHHHLQHELVNFFNGRDIEQAFIETIIAPIEKQNYFYPHNFICLPCEPGCRDCDDNSPCFIKFDNTFRIIVLAIQIFCIISALLIAILTFRLRYTKRVASSRWVMLETILLGAILLYITVIIRYYESSTITCFLEPWFREIGFAFCYGSIVIKVYRIYAEFQTRKAHRVCVQDKDLLKYLFGIVLIVFGYMSAWTALVIDGIDNFRSVKLFGNSFNFTSRNIIDEKYASNGLKFYVCRKLAWDYVTEIGEILFLLSGVYLTYRIRNAKNEIYKEKITLTISILLETVVSFMTYVIRHAFWSHPSLHPDHLLLLYAIRCQVTITITIIMLFMPKFFYKKPKRHPHHRSRYLSSAEVSEMLPDSLHSAILSNGEIDIGEINLSDMDPEDIRAELRRVYTQLQVLKNKSIRKDNPHISKRRGGRKSHRRFSLQPFHHKHKHDQEVTEISKTPEESTASMEGNTSCMPDGPSMAATRNSNSNNNNNNNNHQPQLQQTNMDDYCACANTTSTTNKSYSHRHQ